MERLTKRLHDGKVVTDCDSCEQKKDKQCTFSECRDSLIKRLAAYEDIAELCGGFDRLRELAEADKDGRVSVLPCKPRADMINKILPGSTYLMERVHFAVAYVNKGNTYLMTQRTFEGGVKNGTIVSAATERAMEGAT